MNFKQISQDITAEARSDGKMKSDKFQHSLSTIPTHTGRIYHVSQAALKERLLLRLNEV
jgi:hypothetical protein